MAVVHNAQVREEFTTFPEIIELNVGGQVYITRYPTLVSVQGSLLWEMFSRKNPLSLSHDNKGRFFVDRDGFLFRYVLDYMRDHRLVLPDHFPERSRLRREAEYFKLPDLVKILAPETGNNSSMADESRPNDSEEQCLNQASSSSASTGGPGGSPGTSGDSAVAPRKGGYITLGYRGSYTLGRDSQTDSKFRRVARIMVCGKISLAKEVFGETLNESRDPDRPPERYTSRYYLKFNYLEQAFDRLANAGFHMLTSNSTGTCACAQDQAEDKIWTSYTEYIFYRSPSVQEEEPGFSSSPSCSAESKQKEVARESNQEVARFHNIWELKSHQEDDLNSEGASGTHRFPASSPEQHWEAAGAAGLAEVEAAEDQGSNDARRAEPELSVPFVWPEQDPCPLWPDYRRYYQPFKRSRKAKQLSPRWSNAGSGVPKTGTEDESDRNKASEERRLMEMELGKCIEDFHKIKIPCTFPNKKRPWQSELLQKYHV